MSVPAAEGPNAEQIAYWNDTVGAKWVALQPLLDAQIGIFGRHAMERAAVAPGERVLDVGCGCGDTTLELARRVGETGKVLGVDVSAVMLAQARQRIERTPFQHVRFAQADAQTHAFPPAGVDLVFSRFGVMFFSEAQAAFANLYAALRPGGRVAFVCWRSLSENPWLMVPLAAAAQHITLPPPPAPEAPGPFSLANPERVRDILTRAGFAAIDLAAVDETLTIGDSALDSAVEFLLEIGPTAKLLRENAPAARPAVTAAMREALRPFHTPQGVCLGGATWVVTARR